MNSGSASHTVHVLDESFIWLTTASDARLRQLEVEWTDMVSRDDLTHWGFDFPAVIADLQHQRDADEPWSLYLGRSDGRLSTALYGFSDTAHIRGLSTRIYRVGTDYLADLPVASGTERELISLVMQRLVLNQRDAAFIEFAGLRKSGLDALLCVAKDLKLIVDVTDHGCVYSFETNASSEDFLGSLGPRLRRNLRRARSQMDSRWSMTLERLETSEVEDNLTMLREFCELESAGWKGRNGGAIAAQPQRLAYYQTFVRKAGGSGHLAWFSLKANGRLVSCYLCVKHHGTLSALKTTYDEQLQTVSPGSDLLLRVIQSAISDPSIKRVDMVTGPEWLQLWQPNREERYRLRIFPLSLKGLTYAAAAKFLAPYARNLAIQKKRPG